jgi:hypothetical protein
VKLPFDGLGKCVGAAKKAGDPKKHQAAVDRCLSDKNPDASQFDAPKFDLKKGPPKEAQKSGGIALFPIVKIKGEFNETTCENTVGGELGLAGSGGFETISYAAPLPLYGRVGASLSFDATFGVVGFGGDTGLELSGGVLMIPALKAAVGGGIADVLAVELWLTGGVSVDVIRPREVCEIFARGGITFYALLFERTEPIAVWTYDCGSGSSGLMSLAPLPAASESTALTLVSRDYALADNYAMFQGGITPKILSTSSATDNSNDPRVIQTNVFPRSENVVSAAGDKVYLVWLYDDLARSADNRTVAVFASWDGSAWTPVCGDGTTPCPVFDDGTADFRPQLLALPDGSAHVAWENLRAAPGPDVVLEDMLANLEICTSLFDPAAAPPFADQQCLTDNTYLDRSPTLAGETADNALLAWVSNQQNDMEGGSDAPNLLWSSRYSWGAWSEPQPIAELAFPLSGRSLAYDGTDGFLVMSLDTDEESLVCAVDGKTRCEQDEDCADLGGTCELAATVIDRDLFLLHYDGTTDTWGDLQRLTNDDLVDDSPQVTLDSTGKFLLVWLQEDRLVSVANLAAFAADPDPDSIETIWQDDAAGYSSNLAGFELARNGDQLALVWAQPAEGGYSDLTASVFDPQNRYWGVPRMISEPDLDLETYIAPTFDFADGNPRLLVVYDHTRVTEEEGPEGSTDPPKLVRGQTDLAMLLYPLLHDPALYEFSLQVDPFDPRASTAVTLTVDVVNLGDRGLERAAVRFLADGAEIGTVQALEAGAEPLAPGDQVRAYIDWVVPADAPAGLLISAEIVPDPAIDDRNLSNNETSLSLLSPDLTVEGVSRKHLDGATYEVSATLVNIGSAAVTGPFTVTVHDLKIEGDSVIHEETINGLTAGESFLLSLDYDYDLTLEGSTAEIFVIVDEANVIDESDEENNTRKLVVPSPDRDEPTIVAPDAAVFEATGPGGAIVDLEVSAFDDSGGAISVDCVPALGTVFPLGETQVICTAIDPAGNTVSRAITVSVVDTTPPNLTVPADLTAECTDQEGTSVSLGEPAAGDLYCVDDITLGNNAPVLFPFGDTTVTWTATDCNSNAVSDSQLVTIEDTTPPSLTCPTPRTIECQSDGQASANLDDPSADDCLPVDFTDNALASYPLGSTTVTFTGTDSSGNSASCDTSVTVVDTTSPIPTCPGPLTVECQSDGQASANLGSASAADCSPVDFTDNGLASYPLGSTPVTFTATDSSGNSANCDTSVTVEDTTSPSLTCPTPLTVECQSDGQASANLGSASATDCLPVEFTDNALGSYPLGTTPVTFTATDGSGNSASCDTGVTVEDTTSPSISCPADISLTTSPGQCSITTSFSVSTSDTCDATPRVVCVDQSGASVDPATHVYVVGRTVVTCTSTDASDNSEQCDFAVVVNDPPQVGVSAAAQSVQYSDRIADVTITGTDCGDDDLTLTASALPNGTSLSTASCTTDASGTQCAWTLFGTASVPAGTYQIDVYTNDGLLDSSTRSHTINVSPENAVATFHADNPLAVEVASDGGPSGAFSLGVDLEELEPDQAAFGAALPGNIGLALVTMTLVPVGPGGPVDGVCAPDTTDVSGSSYSDVLHVLCSFDQVSVNTYSVEVTVNGAGYYLGAAETVLVVFDPSLGFTTGGFSFLWPGTTDKVTGGYTMKYNKKRTNVQGNLLLIRHLADGTKYRIKSNSVTGLALGEEGTFGWASFSGKTTYLEPGWDEAVGNHRFLVYVEDHGEPGAGVDRFWLEVRDRDGAVLLGLSMSEPATDNAHTLEGGNIVVPHVRGNQ